MSYHSQPTYRAKRAYLCGLDGISRRVAGRFDIYEIRDGRESYQITLSNRGDLVQNLLKRGFPENDARRLFETMAPAAVKRACAAMKEGGK